jgi:hypothetical protein
MLFIVGLAAVLVPSSSGGEKQKLPGADCIEISAGSAPGIPGPTCRHEYVLKKGGPCRGATILGTTGYTTTNTERTEFVLPAEVFDECRALLESTQFMRLTVKRPELTFEPGLHWVKVRWNGSEHNVQVLIPDGQEPENFKKVFNFLNKLPERANSK